MRRSCLLLALTLCLSLACAVPALAGDAIDGDGYEIRLPPGFTEAMSIEGNGSMNIRSRCGSLPIDGVPEIKAFTAGGSVHPTGMIMIARVNLTRSITTSGELGLDQLEKMKSQLPDGVDVRATTVDGKDAVEIVANAYSGDTERSARVMSIAAGRYVVVVMMETSDEAFADSSAMWSSMIASVKIKPGLNKLLPFAGVGVLGMFGLWFLGQVRSRSAHDAPDYTGRFKRHQDADTGPGFPPRESAEVGRRPKVLASRPDASAPMPEPGRLSTPPMGGTSNFAPDGNAAPVRAPTSPAVTRPGHVPAPKKPGLRATLPDSGRWGD